MNLKELVEKQKKEFQKIWDKKTPRFVYDQFLSQVRLEMAEYILSEFEKRAQELSSSQTTEGTEQFNNWNSALRQSSYKILAGINKIKSELEEVN